MLNLILQKDRKKTRAEYFSRFLNVFFMFSLLSMIVAAVLVFSVNIIVMAENKVATDRLNSVINQENINARNELKELVRRVQSEMRMLSAEETEYSKIIAYIVDMQPEDLNINTIEMKRGEESVGIEVLGVANTRESLVNFSNSLKSVPSFVEVDMPLSNLTQDTSISFDVMIKMEGINIQKENEE